VRHPATLTSNPDRNHRAVDPKADPRTADDDGATCRHVNGHTCTAAGRPNIPHLLTRTHASSILSMLEPGGSGPLTAQVGRTQPTLIRCRPTPRCSASRSMNERPLNRGVASSQTVLVPLGVFTDGVRRPIGCRLVSRSVENACDGAESADQNQYETKPNEFSPWLECP